MTDLRVPEYPGNSIIRKEDPPKGIKPVASGKRLVKKKTVGDIVFGETVRSVGSYIIFEVLIPAAKSTISDMISNGIEMLLYGEPRSRGSRGRDRDRGRSYVSYSSFFGDRDKDRDRGERERLRTSRSRFHLEEIVFESRAEANDVLNGLVDILEQYDSVSVAEFCELANVADEFTDQNWGWVNLRSAEVARIREGYIVDLPEPKLLSR